MNNHNTHFYSKEEVERTLKSTEEFEDGEQLFYFIGTLRYLYDDNIEKDKEIDIMKKYFQMIIDLGYDYDGFNNVKDLKGLIDALCKYASLGKECNTTETIYVNGDKKYNILGEELGGDDNE